MLTLLLATQNKGKLIEMRSLLGDLPIRVISPSDIGLDLEVIEDGSTYAENAALKGLAFCQASGLVSVHSARFAPFSPATDADRRTYLLELLRGKPKPWRAHFHCTIAIATPGGKLEFTEGDCRGEIISEERGTDGFGYDPIFYIPERKATMAELGRPVKNQISHRARAIRAAVPVLKSLI
jgi:XTP/dITP diphosphohydrolase